jgi:hypothetical protein
MKKSVYRRLIAKSRFLSAFLGVCLVTGLPELTLAKSKIASPALAVPEYGDTTTWGRYFRQLQDTVATSWYKEIFYYGYPKTFSRGVVTARYSITPAGKIQSQEILSNSANQPMGGAVIRALRKTWMQPFPPEVSALFPTGLVIEQSFRFNEYDRTNYGLASSYPQTLLHRYPEIGGAKNLDIRKYLDLSIFRYQSRILQAIPASASQIATR